MRRYRFGYWAVGALLISLFLSASRPHYAAWKSHRDTKIYRVAIVPICNPGTTCDPDLPKKLELSFFQSHYGVASFINEVSQGHAHVLGEVLPWIRPKSRLRSPQDLMLHSEELIETISSHLPIEDFDVFFFYTRLGLVAREETWPSGQILKIGKKELKPGLVFIINSEIYRRPVSGKTQSALTPSVGWARELLRAIGLQGTSNTLSCPDSHHLTSCTVRSARDPYSLLGEPTSWLTLNWPTKEALSWNVPSNAKTVEHDGRYRLDLMAKSPKTLVIPLAIPLFLNATTQFDRIYIEKRSLTRFDRALRRSQPDNTQSSFTHSQDHHARGAFLYFGSRTSDGSSTALIDANPNSAPMTSGETQKNSLFAELADTPLLPGKIFQVFGSPITLYIVQATSSSLTIQIDGLTMPPQTARSSPSSNPQDFTNFEREDFDYCSSEYYVL